MATTIIIVLILLGSLFLAAELLLLPGVTIGGILSMCCYGAALYYAFARVGVNVGVIVLLIVLAIAAITLVLCLQAKTWERFSLKQNIESSSSVAASTSVQIGDCGMASSRLAPMGKVFIDSKSYEAKSIEGYIDAKNEVEVVGFEDSVIVVKSKN